MSQLLSYTDEIKRVVTIAQAIAREFGNAQFSGAHLLRALLHKDAGLINFLASIGKDMLYMEEWADVRALAGHGDSLLICFRTGA